MRDLFVRLVEEREQRETPKATRNDKEAIVPLPNGGAIPVTLVAGPVAVEAVTSNGGGVVKKHILGII